MRAEKILSCAEHGKKPWMGHVVCAECGAMYQTQQPGEPFYAPPMCEGCGVRLMPVSRSDDVPHVGPAPDFSARAVCLDCYTPGVPTASRFDGETGRALS